jgi:hypothetical protein
MAQDKPMKVPLDINKQLHQVQAEKHQQEENITVQKPGNWSCLIHRLFMKTHMQP